MKLLLLFSLACCLSATPLAETKPTPVANELVGLWKLVRIEARHPDGSVTADPDFGPKATGYISYDQTGHMSVHIMNPDLPQMER